jgi:hypothetical protein
VRKRFPTLTRVPPLSSRGGAGHGMNDSFRKKRPFFAPHFRLVIQPRRLDQGVRVLPADPLNDFSQRASAPGGFVDMLQANPAPCAAEHALAGARSSSATTARAAADPKFPYNAPFHALLLHCLASMAKNGASRALGLQLQPNEFPEPITGAKTLARWNEDKEVQR